MAARCENHARCWRISSESTVLFEGCKHVASVSSSLVSQRLVSFHRIHHGDTKQRVAAGGDLSGNKRIPGDFVRVQSAAALTKSATPAAVEIR